jgi:NADP-dependent 3-hydroxy acid dehydrogenase YdfG
MVHHRGASSGGRELTKLLLQHEGRVAATVRNSNALQDLAATHAERLWVAILDVPDGERMVAA